MTKVGILTTVHNALDTRIFHKQAASLAEDGYDVTVLAHHEETEVMNEITIKSIGKNNSRKERWKNIKKVYHEAKKEQADVYHIHDPELLPIAIALKQSTGSKIIYDVHENYHASILGKEWLPGASRPFVAESFDITEAQLARWYDGIITASDDIHSRFTHHENVATITNYPLKRWLRRPDTKPDRDSVQIVYCGKITRQRAIPELIEATKILSNYHDIELAIGGNYTTTGIQKLVEQEASKNQHIRTLGWLPTIDDVIDLFHKSHIGAMLIRPDNENQIYGAQRSNKLFQYMSTGTAVVGSDVGNWPEYIEKEDAGICVDTSCLSDMVYKLKELIEDPESRNVMGRNGHEAVKKKYNWENEEEKLLEFYQKII